MSMEVSYNGFTVSLSLGELYTVKMKNILVEVIKDTIILAVNVSLSNDKT